MSVLMIYIRLLLFFSAAIMALARAPPFHHTKKKNFFSAATAARTRPGHLCGGGEPRAAAGRPRRLALHAALDLARHHHERLLDVRSVLGGGLQELDPEGVRERLRLRTQKKTGHKV